MYAVCVCVCACTYTHRSTRVQRGMEDCTRYYQTMLCGIFFFLSSCMYVFSRKLWWGYDTVGKVRWVYIFLLEKKEVKEEKEVKKKLKREMLR